MDSDSSEDFNPKKVESDNENEEKLDKNSESNNHKEEAKEQEQKEDNFNIESNEPDNNNSNSNEIIGETEDMKEKQNIINNNSESINLNKGNQIIFNKRKDLIIIEIDKEKTSQKGYTVYQLNLINDNFNQFNSSINSKKNEKKILCYRRYKDFEKFYNTLKIRFPHCVFPRLSEKNYVMAKVKDDPTFIENRRKELQFFMNKLYLHEIIGKSEEFKHFINYSTFDDEYYNNLPKKFSYPECQKVENDKGYWSMGVQKFSSYFSKPKENQKSELEKNILIREEEFKSKATEYMNLIKEIKTLYETAEEEMKEYKTISNNLLYLKDNDSSYSKNENDINKIKFNELVELNNSFSVILSNNSTNYLSEIINKLNCCILEVEGINRAIERYITYNKEYKKIQEIDVKNNKYVIEEKAKAQNDKIEFEKSLDDDIQKYDKENKKIYEEIIDNINMYIKAITQNNYDVFENSKYWSINESN
jgi:hypothetical protein